jgi:hypothetical protein
VGLVAKVCASFNELRHGDDGSRHYALSSARRLSISFNTPRLTQYPTISPP